jgi:hypothetical protein
MTCRRRQQLTPFPRLGRNQESIVTLLEALPAVSEKELEKLGHTGAFELLLSPSRKYLPNISIRFNVQHLHATFPRYPC